MPTVTADKVINHNLYAKTSVNGYGADLNTVKQTFQPNQLIGNVYSWYDGVDGNLYWMVYANPGDFENFNPTFIRHKTGTLSLPDLPGILAQIEKEKKAAEIADKGLLQYYLDHYLPWILVGLGGVILLPMVISSTRKVNGPQKNSNMQTVGLVAAAAIGIYLLKKKKPTGSIEVGPLDQGSYGTDVVQSTDSATANSGGAGGSLAYVGPFKITYTQGSNDSQVMMSGMKNTMGLPHVY